MKHICMKRNKGLTVFIVAGRFRNSLTASKVEPIICLNNVKRVIIFKSEKGPLLPKTEYVTLPEWIRYIKPHFVLLVVRTFFEIFQLLYYALKLKPAFINGVHTIPTGYYSLIVSALVGCKNIISITGGEIEVKYYDSRPIFFWKWFNLWVYKKSSAITTTGSNVTKYLINNNVPAEKLFEYPGSVDTSKFFDAGIDRDIDILFVGRFTKLKGPDRVLETIKNLCTDFPDCKSCFLGDGYMFNLIQEEVKKYGLKNNVILKGHVQDTECYYNRAKLLLMPSMSEGLSKAMLQAMACGCVPIVSNVGNMTDAALHDLNSLVVNDYLDTSSFTEFAKILLLDKQKWLAFSQNAKTFVRDKYSIEAQSCIIDPIVSKII